MTTDPFEVLGVAPSATLAELSTARRRLAKRLHPDHGGDAGAMQALNAAFDEAVRLLSEPVAASNVAEPAPEPSAPPTSSTRTGRRTVRGVQHDAPSFTIDVLPVEAFEALLVVTSWMGEVLVDDPPYLLEVFLHDPSPCWCRLDLVPDAGATTVSLMVASLEGDPAPDIDSVRDEWVANLNRLGDV
ncbi:MAG: J domain-containing protein [Ilumatobacteraceae bacterium]|nr:J domain-containing protein [Ilumatobacteraceae bacterium]